MKYFSIPKVSPGTVVDFLHKKSRSWDEYSYVPNQIVVYQWGNGIIRVADEQLYDPEDWLLIIHDTPAIGPVIDKFPLKVLNRIDMMIRS